MTTLVALSAVKVEGPTVKTGGGLGVGLAAPRGWVLPATTTKDASEDREMVVPPATTWPPGVRVLPSRMTSVLEFAVYVVPATTMRGNPAKESARETEWD